MTEFYRPPTYQRTDSELISCRKGDGHRSLSNTKILYSLLLQNNGGCSFKCAVQSDGKSRKCYCPSHEMLSADEKTCVPPPSCAEGQFRCRTGKINCIAQSLVCNGQIDCEDSSDEINCPVCDPPHFKCSIGGQCIKPTALCDNHTDCPDGADELCCGTNEFMCHKSHRLCINYNKVCDGKVDCSFGEDENPNHCVRMGDSDPLGTSETSGAMFFIVITASALFLALISYTLWCFKRKATDPIDTCLDDMLSSPLNSFPATIDSRLGRRAPMGLDLLGSTAFNLNRMNHDQPYVDRSNVTGVSSNSSSTGNHYPKETINPPPSPVTTDLYDTSNSSQTASRSSHRGASGFDSNLSRKRLLKQRVPTTTPCTSDVDYDAYRGIYSNSHVEMTYDSGAFPPPPIPYMSEMGSSPSPCTERSFVNPLPNPPPSPVYHTYKDSMI